MDDILLPPDDDMESQEDNIRDEDNSVSDEELGSLFDPWGDHPVGWAHWRIAQILGAFLAIAITGGTTIANFIAVFALLCRGDKVIVERDCHISILQAISIIGAIPVWIKPSRDSGLGVSLGATVSDIREALDRAPDAKAVIITSPKYHGVVGPLKALISECRRRGVKVLVDEAHGALFKFHPVLPTSAVEAGADLVTQSTHKTTEALSQGSAILVGNPDLREAVLDAINSVPAISTSFSYPILASVEEAVANLDEFGWRRIEYALDLAECFRAEIQPLAPAYRTWGAEQAGGPGFKELNPLCVTVDVKGTGLTGFEVNKLLQSDEKGSLRVVAEMADLQNVLFLVSYGNKRSDIDATIARLKLIADKHGKPGAPMLPPLLPPADLPRQAMLPGEAMWAAHPNNKGNIRVCDARDAIRKVSAETVAAFPPGWPIIVQGEIITEAVVIYLRELAARGAHLKGASDNFNTVRVFK